MRAWLVALMLLAACASGPQRAPMKEDAYPGVLTDSAALPAGLFLRQRIDATFGDRNVSFSAVLQVDAGVLSLLALTPYGTRAFLLEQRGQSIHFTRYVDRELPFPPRFVLIDVHRALFSGLGEASAADGSRTTERDGERITERWQAGRLIERTFERLDGKPAGVIRIRYPSADRIELDNGWFGYRLAIRTLADG